MTSSPVASGFNWAVPLLGNILILYAEIQCQSLVMGIEWQLENQTLMMEMEL
jgi:hypothetical protein